MKIKVDSTHGWKIEVEVGTTKRGTHYAVASYTPECAAFGAYRVWAKTVSPACGEYTGEVAAHFTKTDAQEHLDSIVKALEMEVRMTS